MTKIREYDKFVGSAKWLGFTMHKSGEYYYKQLQIDKDTYIYISTSDRTMWIERQHEIVRGIDEIALCPKRLQRYI